MDSGPASFSFPSTGTIPRPPGWRVPQRAGTRSFGNLPVPPFRHSAQQNPFPQSRWQEAQKGCRTCVGADEIPLPGVSCLGCMLDGPCDFLRAAPVCLQLVDARERGFVQPSRSRRVLLHHGRGPRPCLFQIGVSISPGSTIETRMPQGRSSILSASEMPSSACFDATEGPTDDPDPPDKIHLQLLPKLLQRDTLQGTGY